MVVNRDGSHLAFIPGTTLVLKQLDPALVELGGKHSRIGGLHVQYGHSNSDRHVNLENVFRDYEFGRIAATVSVNIEGITTEVARIYL